MKIRTSPKLLKRKLNENYTNCPECNSLLVSEIKKIRKCKPCSACNLGINTNNCECEYFYVKVNCITCLKCNQCTTCHDQMIHCYLANKSICHKCELQKKLELEEQRRREYEEQRRIEDEIEMENIRRQLEEKRIRKEQEILRQIELIRLAEEKKQKEEKERIRQEKLRIKREERQRKKEIEEEERQLRIIDLKQWNEEIDEKYEGVPFGVKWKNMNAQEKLFLHGKNKLKLLCERKEIKGCNKKNKYELIDMLMERVEEKDFPIK